METTYEQLNQTYNTLNNSNLESLNINNLTLLYNRLINLLELVKVNKSSINTGINTDVLKTELSNEDYNKIKQIIKNSIACEKNLSYYSSLNDDNNDDDYEYYYEYLNYDENNPDLIEKTQTFFQIIPNYFNKTIDFLRNAIIEKKKVRVSTFFNIIHSDRI